MVYIFFNPLSNNRHGTSAVEEVKKLFSGEETKVEDITKIGNAAVAALNLDKSDIVVICGGDGTVQRFINQAYGINIPQEIYYFPSGSGNDFAHDLENEPKYKEKLIPLKKYYESLPVVTVNGITKRFINGIGFGIDGYCCEEGDNQRANSVEKINYTSIAIKGLMGEYKPCNATVTVDGVSKFYKKVWLAPAMIGKYYGGGMMIAPSQNRLNAQKTLTSVVWSGCSKFRTLMCFPKVFKGEHVKYKKLIDIREGHTITVEFTAPQALQIDGETVKNVTSYSVTYK